jgi:hypothetical protein
VIRLCTDESRIVDYWNNIDAELEINMDVLDDFESEAKECYVVSTFCMTRTFFFHFFYFSKKFELSSAIFYWTFSDFYLIFCSQHNKWLTYGMPIQRMREFGTYVCAYIMCITIFYASNEYL